MRIKAALYNAEHLEYGLVSIPFPIPQDEYSETVRMLEALDIGGPRARDCTVEEIEGSVPSLKCLEGRKINVDELDYLAKRLDSFTDGELAQFQGMAVKMGLNDMTDLINLTFCCQEATVITDFSDLEQIGRDHYMNLHGGCASMEELEQLDGAEIALLLISENEGTVTPYGVVYDNGMQLSQVYQGRNFPAYLYEDILLAVTLRPIHADANDSQAVCLYLPTSELQIERMLCRDGMESEDFARLEIQANNLPAAIQTVCDLELESVFDLNAMCAAISTLTQADRLKLDAAEGFAKPESVAEICRLAENLDLFDFVPNVHTPEEYGRYMIQNSGQFSYDSDLDEFYDYGKYGRRCMEQNQGMFTSQGYISYHGTLTMEELMMEDPAEQYRKEQEEIAGMEMS